MKNQHEQSSGEVPKQILDQLNEHTAGGFVLFYFNSEDGSLEHVCNFDSPTHAAAVQKYIDDWVTALNSLSIDNIKANMIRSFQEPPEDEEKIKN